MKAFAAGTEAKCNYFSRFGAIARKNQKGGKIDNSLKIYKLFKL